MKKELELKLVEKYPVIFKQYGGDIRKTCMGWGFSHSDDWYDLIDRMCADITTLSKGKGIQVVAEQVKEKFGTLRFYYCIEFEKPRKHRIKSTIQNLMFNHKLGKLYWKLLKYRRKIYRTIEEKIGDRIDDAEYESSKTCEICGKPGKRRGGGWIVTLCDECDKPREQVKERNPLDYQDEKMSGEFTDTSEMMTGIKDDRSKS
jgi:CRISPR/Cas system-associated protein Cas10 (large subunit of type III CRISPR-Cas system)